MTGREAAVRALLAWEKQGAWSDAFLDALFRREKLPARESALAQQLCCGVIQNRTALDWYLKPYVRGTLQPAVLAILRCAVYQLAFLDRIPASAAVDTAVELTKTLANPAAARVVHAILRRLAAEPLPSLPQGTDGESLALRYSHPEWLVRTWRERLGGEDCCRLLEADNAVPPTILRVNRLRAEPEEAAAALAAEGADFAPLDAESLKLFHLRFPLGTARARVAAGHLALGYCHDAAPLLSLTFTSARGRTSSQHTSEPEKAPLPYRAICATSASISSHR